MESWRRYCLSHVEINTPEQRVKLERLIDLKNPDIERAWSNLAGDCIPEIFSESDGTTYVIEWQEALHNVIDCLIFPPGIIRPATKAEHEQVRRNAVQLRNALRKAGYNSNVASLDYVLERAKAELSGKAPHPLIPGKTAENKERNWLALYLRERIIRPFFFNPHHEDIARLVNVALNIDTLTPEAVRLLKPRSSKHP